MPSGRKDIYGAPSRRLADPKVIKAEMGAQRNAAAAARLAGRKLDADKLLAREGTTNPSGGRPNKPATPKPATKTPIKATQGSGMGAVSDRDMQLIKGAGARLASKPKPMPQPISKTKPIPKVKPSPAKTPKPQVIRTTTNMKPTPTGKKR